MMQCDINPLRHFKKAFQLNTSTTATTLHSKKKNKQTWGCQELNELSNIYVTYILK